MAESPHYKELLQVLNKFRVEFLIVGGFAVMKYGEPRYTKSRVSSTLFDVPVNFISWDDLVTNKRALGRAGDLKDLKPKS